MCVPRARQCSAETVEIVQALVWSVQGAAAAQLNSSALCRHDCEAPAKCTHTVKLCVPAKSAYSQLAWCANGTIAAATGGAVHFVSSRSGQVIERIEGAHQQRITGLTASAALMPCHGEQRAVVATSGRDGKARIWSVPDLR